MERWKEIDIAPGFTISESGVVRDPEGNIRNNYRNGDGYVGVAIKIPTNRVDLNLDQLRRALF